MNEFGPVISDEQVGAVLLQKIHQEIAGDKVVIVDFQGVKSMVTFVAKQVFGELYVSLGAREFFNRIKMKNITPGLQAIIKLGISDAVSGNQAVHA